MEQIYRERKECTEVEKLYLMCQDFSLIQNMGSYEDIISITVSIRVGWFSDLVFGGVRTLRANQI